MKGSAAAHAWQIYLYIYMCTVYKVLAALPARTVANKTAGQFLAKPAGLPRVAASSAVAAAVYIYMKIIPDNRQGSEGGTRDVWQRGAATGCHSVQAKNNEHF